MLFPPREVSRFRVCAGVNQRRHDGNIIDQGIPVHRAPKRICQDGSAPHVPYVQGSISLQQQLHDIQVSAKSSEVEAGLSIRALRFQVHTIRQQEFDDILSAKLTCPRERRLRLRGIEKTSPWP